MPLRPAKTYLLPSLGVTFILLVCATFAKASHVALPYQLCLALFQLSAVVSFVLLVINTVCALRRFMPGGEAAS